MTARVLVTRAMDQAGPLVSALRAEGLDPIVVPVIDIEIEPPRGPLDLAAMELHRFAWVVVTSANGARAILTAAERVFTALGAPSWAAIGDATAGILEREGIEDVFRPSRPDALTLAEELPLRPGGEVLVLRGDLASDELPRRLRDRGAVVTDVTAYRTVEGPPSARPILRDALASRPPDAVLFASGSAVRGLLSLAQDEELDVRSLPAICIGPSTAREAARLGFEILATSPVPDAGTLAATTAAALAQPLETR